MNLGSLLRRNRRERGLTLKMVSEKAGISEGFLSQVENNVSSPSVDTLMSVCAAIGVNAGDLLNQASEQENLVILRRADWEEVDIPHTGFATRRFFPPENRSVIDSSVLVLEPGHTIPVRKNIRNSQEVLCVLKGGVTLTLGDNTVPMEEGDTVHYWSDPDNQKITNNSEHRSIILWIGTI